MTKSQIIREGIKNYESMRENRMYPLRINDVLESLGKEYSVNSCGILGDDILSGKGLWIDLHADYSVPEPKRMEFGMCCVTMKGNKIHVEGGASRILKEVCCFCIGIEKRRYRYELF